MEILFKTQKAFKDFLAMIKLSSKVSNKVIFYNDLLQPCSRTAPAVTRKVEIKEEKLDDDIDSDESEKDDVDNDEDNDGIRLTKGNYLLTVRKIKGRHMIKNVFDTIDNGLIYVNEELDVFFTEMKNFEKGVKNILYKRDDKHISLMINDKQYILATVKESDPDLGDPKLNFDSIFNQEKYSLGIEDLRSLKDGKLLVITKNIDNRSVAVRIAKSELAMLGPQRKNLDVKFKCDFNIFGGKDDIYNLLLYIDYNNISVIHQYMFINYIDNPV